MKRSILIFAGALVSAAFAAVPSAVGGVWDGNGDFAAADHIERKDGGVVLTWDKPDRRPVWFGGWSAAKGVGGEGDYCAFVDIQYADGTWQWAERADFHRGTHARERSERLFVPAKPVSRIEYFLFLRNGSGTAEFGGAFLRRQAPDEGHVLRERRFTMQPWKQKDRIERLTVVKGRECVDFREVESARSRCPLSSGRLVVWTADSMRRVYPLDFPTEGDAASPRIELEMARGEAESCQICISAAADVPSAPVTVRPSGDFPGEIAVNRIGYLARRDGYGVHPCGRAEDELWFPEPLLPVAGMRSVSGGTVGAWLTFKAPRGARAATFDGTVTVAVGTTTVRIPYRVTVRPFALPERFGLKTAFCLMDGFLRAAYPDEFKRRKREGWDIMLDHRLNPDDITRTSPPDLDDLEYARSRGMNSFNVLNLVPPPKDPNAKWVCWVDPETAFSETTYAYFRKTLSPYVAELERRGLKDMAYLYGFDERGKDFYEGLLPLWKRLKADFGLPVMTTAYMFQDAAKGTLKFDDPHATMTDIHVPLESVYDPALADRYRAAGRSVWWYTAAGPGAPWCNIASYENPLIECRVLGWVLRRTRADGYLYWHVNFWGDVKVNEADTFFPDWSTSSWLGSPGDGVFLYPGRQGILPGIRLANVRDGVEDYEWLQLAEKSAGREKVEAILKTVADSGRSFTRESSVVRRARAALTVQIEK